ncbi:serine protease [Haloechinothrix salitolerans]|uniref:Serine protease n=1 Tax=Haloechinothrix salitolerans TaxID=926830 RepID=A0ABW2C1K7_9PSEU
MARLVGAVARAAGVGVAVVTVVAAGLSGAHAKPVEPAIVGGQDAEIEDFPFTVALRFSSSGEQFCGGTLVAPDKVVTAAHCVAPQDPGDLAVVSGRTELSSNDGTVSDVSDIWVHPDNGTDGANYDVAVLTLAESLDRRTADLAERDDPAYEPDTEATVLGWGRTSEGGESADHLQQVQVPITTDEYCSDAYGDSYRKSGMFCAGLDEGGKDACQGDSGGPIVVGSTLIGVVSWGEGCARPGKPGVYAKVGAFVEELSDQIGDDEGDPNEPEPTSTSTEEPEPTTEPTDEPAPQPEPAPTSTPSATDEPAPQPQPAPTTTPTTTSAP